MSLVLPILGWGGGGASVWLWATMVIGLVWLRRHLDLRRAASEPVLSAADADGQGPLPKLTVLVAAKDEEPNIRACLEGLLRQDYPALEVVAINDRSADRTGEIIDEFAARDTRVRAVHVSELPAGWFGKTHAMHLGVQQASGEYLCFTDADCRFHDAKLLAAAVRFSRREAVGFLSVLPRLEAHTFWERVVQPPAGAIMVFWFPPEKVNNPRSPRAYANGAFMLTSRAGYQQLGGHEGGKAVLNEDMHLARQAKRSGLGLRVIRADGMYSVRMYVGFRAIWRGWTRIFYGCFASIPRLLLSAVFLLVFSLSPYVALLWALIAGSNGVWLGLAAVFAVAAQQSVLWRFYGLCDARRAWALSYPLGAGLCAGMMIAALGRHFGGATEWRGTQYHGGVGG